METDSESDNDKMDSDDYKQVSFSPKVEVLEIESRRPIRNVKNNIIGLRADGIKNRLGEIKIRQTSNSNSNLHNIRKPLSMKSRNLESVKSKMIADQSPINIKSRLDMKKIKIGQASIIRSRLNKAIERKASGKKKSDVFNRLGNIKKA